MEKFKRSLFFWILVLLFFITTPAIILHTQGYRFDIHRGVFVYSGTITIKSNPQDINVTLNNELRESKQLNRINNSYNLDGLLPGDYSIHITANGFQPWSKKIDVHSGVSSEFWNVILARNNYERLNYSDTAEIENFYLSPQNKYIAYTRLSEEGLSVSLFNISDERTEQNFILPGWRLLDETAKENIEWSPDENYLSVPVEAIDDSNNRSYFIFDIDNRQNFNLNELMRIDNIRSVRWDARDEGYLLFLTENNLRRSNINNPSEVRILAENVINYDITRQNIYYLQLPNNLVYKSSFDGQGDKIQITYNFPDNFSTLEKIIIYDEDRIAFINKDKDLFIYNKGLHDTYFKKLGTAVEGIHFSDDGKKLLLWTKNEISVYFLRDWEVQPLRNEDEFTNVTRYGEKIDNVQWHKDYEHIIFSTGRYAKIIELDPRDHRNSSDLINTQIDNPFIRYNKSSEILYFTDKNEEGQSILQTIIFPEPVPILGLM